MNGCFVVKIVHDLTIARHVATVTGKAFYDIAHAPADHSNRRHSQKWFNEELAAVASLHRRRPAHKFGSVIKLAALTGVLVLLISFLLIACASDTEDTPLSKPSISENSSESPDVPGEKMGDNGRVSPGAMGSTVHW